LHKQDKYLRKGEKVIITGVSKHVAAMC